MLKSNRLRICITGLIASTLLSACNLPRSPMSVKKPVVIEFASRMGSMEIDLKGKCEATEVVPFHMIDSPKVTSQFQLNCYGFKYFGLPRLAQFMFINDALAAVMINVEPDEVPLLENAFIKTFGPPSHSKDTVLAFADHFAGVRNDPAQAVYFAEFTAPYLIDAIEMRPDRE